MSEVDANEAKPSKPGDPYIAFGNALNNGDTTIEKLAGLAFECGLILAFGVQPDPGQSVDIDVTKD